MHLLSPLPHFSLIPQCSPSGFHWNQFCPGCYDFHIDCTIAHLLVLLLDFSAALGNVGHLFFLDILCSPDFHVPFSPCSPCTCFCPSGGFCSLPLEDLCFLLLHSCLPTLHSLHSSLVSSFICIIFTATTIYLRVQSHTPNPNCAFEFHSQRSNFVRDICTSMFDRYLSTI